MDEVDGSDSIGDKCCDQVSNSWQDDQTDFMEGLSEVNSGQFVNNSPVSLNLSPTSLASEDMGRISPIDNSLDCSDHGSMDGIGSAGLHVEDYTQSFNAGITSSWVSSGGNSYGTTEFSDDVVTRGGLGYVYSTPEQRPPNATLFLRSEVMPGTSATAAETSSDNNNKDSNLSVQVMPWQPYNSLQDAEQPKDVVPFDVAGDCGIQNLGNTCFMNAGLQCLINTPPFAQYFLDHLQSGDNLIGMMREMVHKVWSGNFQNVRPVQFKEAFGAHYVDFRDYRQHDCQEFVTLLLEGLHKQKNQKMVDCEQPSMNAVAVASGGVFYGPYNYNKDILEAEVKSMDGVESSKDAIDLPPCSLMKKDPIHCPVDTDEPMSTEVGDELSASMPSCSSLPPSPRAVVKSDAEELLSVEDGCEDSGANSPKSSISSSSVDSHQLNLRLQPIPEEVRHSKTAKSVCSPKPDSTSALSCTLTENVPTAPFCDGAEAMECVSSSSSVNEAEANGGLSSLKVNILDIMKETKTSNVNVLVKKNHQNNDLIYDSEKYAKCDKVRLQDSLDNLGCGGKRNKDVNVVHQYQNNLRNKRSNADSESLTSGDTELSTPEEEMSDCSDQMISKKMRLEEKNVQHEQHNMLPSGSNELGNSAHKVPTSKLNERTKRMGEAQAERDYTLSEENWQSFIGEGKETFLMDTFYGQFKSSLICSVCGHNSVKFDPFGTLSVPLPHANEVQIVVTYMSSDTQPAFKCLLTLCKISNVGDIKFSLIQLLTKYYARQNAKHSTNQESGSELKNNNVLNESKKKRNVRREPPDTKDVVVGEVFDNHISRILDDSLQTKSLNCSSRSIYAFHLPVADEVDLPGESITSDQPKENVLLPDLIPSFEKSDLKSSGEVSNSNLSVKSKPITVRGLKGGAIEMAEANISKASVSSIKSSLEGTTYNNDLSSGNDRLVSSDLEAPSDPSNNLNLQSLFDVPESSNKELPDQNEWKTCNICLEEMCLSELKSHGLCYDCLLCESCIDMSCKHHGGDCLVCPVCHANLTRGSLIPVARRQTEKPKPRILRMCVVFRLDAESPDNNKRTSNLVGHPRLVNVPSRLPLSGLHKALKQFIPPGAEYSLLLVDGAGYNCSRCLFMSHCRGCEVGIKTPNSVKDDIIINLQTGDTVCVKFSKLSAVQRNYLTQTREHESLALRRQDEPLTLYDCLRAFTQSETLESSESWFCPECQCKQPATKTVSLWKCPDYLIIHLERFLFHGTMSNKVDDKVIFPLENLCMGDYFGGRQLDSPHIYNLYGIVCHMGSMAQAGHYTSLVKNPVSSKWRLFNDENCIFRKPSEEEFSTAYLLFYHRSDVNFSVTLPREFSFDIPKKEDDKMESNDENMKGCLPKSFEAVDKWKNDVDTATRFHNELDVSQMRNLESEISSTLNSTAVMHNDFDSIESAAPNDCSSLSRGAIPSPQCSPSSCTQGHESSLSNNSAMDLFTVSSSDNSGECIPTNSAECSSTSNIGSAPNLFKDLPSVFSDEVPEKSNVSSSTSDALMMDEVTQSTNP